MVQNILDLQVVIGNNAVEELVAHFQEKLMALEERYHMISSFFFSVSGLISPGGPGFELGTSSW